MRKKIISLGFLSFFFFVIFFDFCFANKDFLQSVLEFVEQDISQQKNQNLSRVVWMETFRQIQKGNTLSPKTKKLLSSIIAHLFSGSIALMSGSYDDTFRKVFLDQYGSGITTPDIFLPSRCFNDYLLIDLISWSMNIPTALTIATRKIEADCKYGPYKNGPFQLMSYTYPTEKVDYMLFVRQIIDFALFTKHKWASYARANTKQGLQVEMNYTSWTFDAIVKHGALYNGLSGRTIIGEIQPLQKEYVWGNFGMQNSGAIKDGLVVNFLKALYWEMENRKKVYDQTRELLELQ